jgi:phospholipase C
MLRRLTESGSFKALSLPSAAVLLAMLLQGGCSSTNGDNDPATATPVKHLVVIYMENASFDLMFGTYPDAINPEGEPEFEPRPGTPSVNNLTGILLTDNPNETNPFRIGRLESFVCDQDHDYAREQQARNGGLMNKFVKFDAEPPTDPRQFCSRNAAGHWDTVMGYFDGNTVTAVWNYAQNYAMSDNFFATTSGMSTRGHLNLTAADTFGVICAQDQNVIGPEIPHCGGTADSTDVPAPTNGKMATFNIDVDPFWDICSDASMGGTAALGDRPTIGNLLNDAGITWGWFQGGFALDPGDKCTSSHPLVSYDIASGVDPAQDPVRIIDYVPHHNPFQYFRSTANPSHLPPSSVDMIGQTDQANHLYDIPDLWKTADAGHLPSVIFIKPPGYQNGHPGYSDPLDAQTFIVETVNRLMQLPEWSDMAIFIAWDDSDGWYDHVMPPIINQSATNFDYLCGDESDGPGGRCGYGPRLPFIVVSPYAKENYVSNSLADQTSITRFIEDNWLKGRRLTKISFDNRANSLLDLFDFSKRRDDKLILDPATGQPE